MSSSLGYPSRYIEALLRSISPSRFDLQGVLVNLASATAAASAGPLDHLYARIGALNGPFFPAGWGNLSVVNYEEDLRHLIAGPPSNIKLAWRLVERGRRNDTEYVLYEGTFRTPCLQRVYDALPPESRTGRVQLLMPARLQPFYPDYNWPLNTGSSSSTTTTTTTTTHEFSQQQQQQRHQSAEAAQRRRVDAPACVVHLAATGDQTFGRRLRLGFPLLKDNVCSLVLESPFYGARRPAAQRGSKLLRVSDLLTLGWATISESVNLLHWLREEGYGALGMCGLSMGGVHASMTAGLFPGEVAVAPLLAPRSAAVAYCDGAMRAAMAWEPLLKEVDEQNNRITQLVMAAGRAVRVELPRGAAGLPGPPAADTTAAGGGGAVALPAPVPEQAQVQCVALMREATYALADLEARGEKRHLAAPEPGSGVGSGAEVFAASVAARQVIAGTGSSGADGVTAAAASASSTGGNVGGGSDDAGSGWTSRSSVLGLPFVSVMDLQRGLAWAALRGGAAAASGDGSDSSSRGGGGPSSSHPRTAEEDAAPAGATGRQQHDHQKRHSSGDFAGPFSGIIPVSEPGQGAGGPENGHAAHPHPHATSPKHQEQHPHQHHHPPARTTSAGHRPPHPPPHAPDIPFPLQQHHHHHPQPQQPAEAGGPPANVGPASSAGGASAGSGSAAATGGARSGSAGGGGTVLGRRLLGDLGRAVKQLRADDRRLDRPDTVLRLKQVLETYTDITRYPRPRRTDAAVIVAARDDAYVSRESVQQLHGYWAGSELRLVSGGHVSAFLMHQQGFREAIRDSLARVARPPPPQQQ